MIPRTARARWRRRRAASFLIALVVVACAAFALLEPTGPLFVWTIVLGTVAAVLLLLTYDPAPIPPREDPHARPDNER